MVTMAEVIDLLIGVDGELVISYQEKELRISARRMDEPWQVLSIMEPGEMCPEHRHRLPELLKMLLLASPIKECSS